MGGERGYDAHKKSERPRAAHPGGHDGNLPRAVVHAADRSDSAGGTLLLSRQAGPFTTIRKLWADQRCKATFVDWVTHHLSWEVEPPAQQGLPVLPRIQRGLPLHCLDSPTHQAANGTSVAMSERPKTPDYSGLQQD